MHQVILRQLRFSDGMRQWSEEAQQIIRENDELIKELSILELKCPKTFWLIEQAFVNSYLFQRYYKSTHECYMQQLRDREKAEMGVIPETIKKKERKKKKKKLKSKNK